MVFDRYLLRSLIIATVFTTLTLTLVILLTQSLRFLELMIESGASGSVFWILTALALPRFFEVILPLALMISVIFIYNRMSMDSEIIVMRASGFSPLRLARPALIVATGVTIILLGITTWLAPVSVTGMHRLKQVVKAQYSTLLFREGVFNTVGKNITVYIRNRTSEGELQGILVHDSRPELKHPTTIIAKRGVVVATDEGQQVLVYDGSRQDFNPESRALNRLDFERYTIDLPDSAGAVRQRWREPEERTFIELLNPDPNVQWDMGNKEKFLIEAHRRIVSPFLALSFTIVSLAFLLLGPVDRRGQARRIAAAIVSVILIQGFYLGVYNLAHEGVWGLGLMYLLVFAPLVGGAFLLSGAGENLRHKRVSLRRTKTAMGGV